MPHQRFQRFDYQCILILVYIITDVGEIHGRLFDHRPILQGHIRAFVKEFEVFLELYQYIPFNLLPNDKF